MLCWGGQVPNLFARKGASGPPCLPLNIRPGFNLLLLQPFYLDMCHCDSAKKMLLHILTLIWKWLMQPEYLRNVVHVWKKLFVKTHSLCRAALHIWWILWEAPAPPAAPGRQRRRATPPRCCTSPPLCSGLHGTAEHPPCASDLTMRRWRDNINVMQTAENT